MRSILDLNIDELKAVIETGTLPEDVTLDGLEARKDFARFFRYRATPSMIATFLLREKLTLQSQGSEDIKKKRLELKEKEL